jgi:hypothetical protein
MRNSMPPNTVGGVCRRVRGFGLNKGVIMSENSQCEPVKASHRMRGFIFYVALLHIAFLLGFVPMWLRSRRCSSSLSQAERK